MERRGELGDGREIGREKNEEKGMRRRKSWG